jgi:hypothetical protein
MIAESCLDNEMREEIIRFEDQVRRAFEGEAWGTAGSAATGR